MSIENTWAKVRDELGLEGAGKLDVLSKLAVEVLPQRYRAALVYERGHLKVCYQIKSQTETPSCCLCRGEGEDFDSAASALLLVLLEKRKNQELLREDLT